MLDPDNSPIEFCSPPDNFQIGSCSAPVVLQLAPARLQSYSKFHLFTPPQRSCPTHPHTQAPLLLTPPQPTLASHPSYLTYPHPPKPPNPANPPHPHSIHQPIMPNPFKFRPTTPILNFSGHNTFQPFSIFVPATVSFPKKWQIAQYIPQKITENWWSLRVKVGTFCVSHFWHRLRFRFGPLVARLPVWQARQRWPAGRRAAHWLVAVGRPMDWLIELAVRLAG